MHFIDCQPRGVSFPDPPEFVKFGLGRSTYSYATLKSAPMRRLGTRLVEMLSRGLFVAFHRPTSPAVSQRGWGLARILRETSADFVAAYNIDAFLPCAEWSRRRGKPLVLDCQEFYADMGDSQSTLNRSIADAVQRATIPRANLVLATTQCLAGEIVRRYGDVETLVVYNAPPLEDLVSEPRVPWCSLYWRNYTVDFGQRGLDDILVALAQLPPFVRLCIQGRATPSSQERIRSRCRELGVQGRVELAPSYRPNEAVAVAARHHIGLCPEQPSNLNQRLTASNKIFDFMMAGLPVVASDVDGLREVVESSGGGLLYSAGQPDALANVVRELCSSQETHARLAEAARQFAVREGNLEVQMGRLTKRVLATTRRPETGKEARHQT